MIEELDLDFPEITSKKSVKKLHEKWVTGEGDFDKLWWTDSEFEFRDYLRSLALNKVGKGYRLLVGTDTYAVASGLDIDHYMMASLLREAYLPVGDESYTLGIPTIKDFDEGNFEFQDLYDVAYITDEERDFSLWDIEEPAPDNLSREEFFAWFNSHYSSRPDGTKVAVCDGFEISLELCPLKRITNETFKTHTELGKALGNLFKYIR